MDIIDFTDYPATENYYGGSEQKIGIKYHGESYMLKFQKKTPFGLRFNTISEYLGCHIYQLLDMPCQETFLGTYQGNNVVACKLFNTNGKQFVPFNDVGESTIEEDINHYQYDYEDIIKLLEANKKLTDVEETISFFFEIYIVDALLGNFDRHGGNWGFLKKNNKYTIAPVFDNGSCLYPNLTDEDEIKNIIHDQEQIDLRIFRFPTSQIRLNGNKSSYFDVISSLQFKEINKALLKIYPRINFEKIDFLIDSIDIISEIRKNFYKTMIRERCQKILKPSYEKLIG